jgi:hypothetical protein
VAGPVTAYPAVSATGHRDLTTAQLAWLRPELDRVLAKLRGEHGTTAAAYGAALGADTEFGWAALHAGLELHAHIPYPEQADRWPTEDQATYRRLLERCTSKTVYGPSFAVKWLFVRNDGLIDFAIERGGVLLAIWDPDVCSGGTYDTVRKAAVRGLPAIHLDPAAMVTHGPGCSCVTGLAAPKLL